MQKQSLDTRQNGLITLKIEKIVAGGKGLAHLPNGCVCFVEGALPGEAVKAQIIKQKKEFAEAVTLDVLEANPRRQKPLCSYYGKCGGCNASYAKFDLQIEVLREIIFDLFLRIAKLNLPQDFEIHSGSEWGYRHRAQVFKTGGEVPWGFQARASNTVVPVKECPVLSQNLNERLKERCDVKKRYIFDNQTEKFLGEHIFADDTVFFQNNLPLLPELIEFIKREVGEGDRLLDVFGGVGLFSHFLQDKFRDIIIVEQNALCEKFARKNLSNCRFYSESIEDMCRRKGAFLPEDCVIADPPRTGLPKVFCEYICENRVRKLIYVSCEPSTLARDAAKLISSGYKLQDIRGFAFYPQTWHVEMLAVFS